MPHFTEDVSSLRWIGIMHSGGACKGVDGICRVMRESSQLEGAVVLGLGGAGGLDGEDGADAEPAGLGKACLPLWS